MEIPAEIVAQQAMARQNFALSMIKKNSEAAQAIAGILESGSENIAQISGSSRGASVNIRA
jgi:hypothetical protein